jgi:elongation factor G
VEDPCARIEHNSAANETVLYGMGEFHLRMLLERLADRYNVKVRTHPPSIAYRETVTAAAEGHYRHKKQTGGAGQFGEVHLRVEALPRGAGFEFDSAVVGGAIPSQFIPAVEKGVRQVLENGAIAGYPVDDLKVTVCDGKHHPVDSKEIAFVTAGRKAFLDAISRARPILLEPIVKVEMFAPSNSMGDLAGDLSSRRGRINGNRTLSGDRVSILGEVPLAEFRDYQTRLKSLTGGEGEFTMDFSHYEPVPPDVQKELIANYQRPDDGE